MTPETLQALKDEAVRLGYTMTHTRELLHGVEYVLMLRKDNTVAFRVTAPMELFD